MVESIAFWIHDFKNRQEVRSLNTKNALKFANKIATTVNE